MSESNKSDQSHFPYLPHTEADREEMLKAIGVRTFEELLAHIPKDIRVKELNLAAGLNELELTQKVTELARKNKPASQQACFLGGGSYRRFVPASVGSIISRSEFATAYTPYQPEVSQGSLQAIYEFQTAICLLTDMEVANASMYDGQTALAEAAMMACRLTGRKKVVIAESLNPEYALIVRTYLDTAGIAHISVSAAGGVVDASKLSAAIDDKCAALLVQYPNYFGCIEDLEEIKKQAEAAGSLFVVLTDPIAMGLLTPPGAFGADIVVGDAQQCGNQLSFGGPTAGFMATRTKYVRQLPGRLAGQTMDNRGQRAFTLTLQTREQHIRRQNATSNICTNQALNALAMLVYLSLMGPQGLRDAAEISVRRAHHLAELLTTKGGLSLRFNQPFVNEFVVRSPVPVRKLLDELKEQNILGGIELGRFLPTYEDCLLVAVTETNSPAELEHYADVVAKITAGTNAKERSGKTESALAHKR
jgi:glycine dehydrogenase subunit 1